MSVAGNLSFPLEVRGMAPAERAERVERALRLVRLEGMEARRPAQLSGGQQQRVAIARALVFEPELVLMDEPLGALDRRLREEMQYEIRRIQRELGVTVVYVTHDQQEAMVLSDRVAVFNEGRIEQIDPPEVLYEEPERAFVARFIGENNLVHGTVLALQDRFCDVDVAGVAVRAACIAPLEVGERTTLAIRPERVGVGDPSGRFANEFEATVDDITFLGDHLRVNLAIGEIKDFVAKIPNVTGAGRRARRGPGARGLGGRSTAVALEATGRSAGPMKLASGPCRAPASRWGLGIALGGVHFPLVRRAARQLAHAQRVCARGGGRLAGDAAGA